MHIVTMMAYKKKAPLLMCKAFLYLVKRFNPQATVSVFYQGDIGKIRTFARNFKDIHFILLDRRLTNTGLNGGFAHHPVQDLRFGVWRKLESMGLNKFIYLDADALPIASLDQWWQVVSEKPYIAIDERLEGKERLFNAGVHSYSSSTGFVTYRKLRDQYRRDGNRIRIQAGEQGIVNALFRRLNYDYVHPKIGFEYNSLAKYSRVVAVNDKDIEIYSGDYPILKKIVRRVTFSKANWAEGWMWWGQKRRVKVLHSFGGPGYRFWDLPECRTFWDYCTSKVG